jgi:hypothetical protein
MVLSNAEFNRQFKAATRRGNRRLNHRPVADAVRFDRRLRKIVISLSNGCTLLVPPELAQGLADASPEALSGAKVLGPGTAIEWPKLDVQLSVAGLLSGDFGTTNWMNQLDQRTGTTPVPRSPSNRRRLKVKRSS